jgi:hypothetical protein
VKTKLGADDLHTLTSMNNLASIYINWGRYEEADTLQVQGVETFKRMLGEQYPLTLTCVGNLAFTWND